MRPPGNKVTSKERAFALEYLANGGNAADAARGAGYSERRSVQTGSELLGRRHVAAFIAEQAALSATRVKQRGLELTADRVLLETMRIGYADVRQLHAEDGSFKKLLDWPDDAVAAVAGVEYEDGKIKKIKFWDKPRALEMLGKHLRLWTEVIEQRIDGLDDQARAERAAALIAAALERRKLAEPTVVRR